MIRNRRRVNSGEWLSFLDLEGLGNLFYWGWLKFPKPRRFRKLDLLQSQSGLGGGTAASPSSYVSVADDGGDFQGYRYVVKV